MAIDILNPNLGLQGVLDPVFDQPSLPEARPLPSNVVAETGLAKHFDLTGMAQLIDRALIPGDIDEELLRPDIFRRNLAKAHDILKSSADPKHRRFARDDLAPILEDGDL
jgi:type III secretion protein X